MNRSARLKLHLCFSAWVAALLPITVLAESGTVDLVCRMSVPAKLIAGKPVSLTFTLANRGKMTVHVLKVNTALEGFYGKFLRISGPQGELEYTGAMVKRAPPTAEDYASIKPGATRSKTLNLATAYALNLPGKYELTFKGRLLDVTTGKIPRAVNEQTALDVDCPVVRFEISARK